MRSGTNPIPEGYRSVVPYLIVRGGDRAIEFYKQAFDGTEQMRLLNADGLISHAEVMIGDSLIMLTDEKPDFPDMRSPQALGGSPVHIHLYVADVDTVISQALALGATLLMEPSDQAEDRRGGVTDPFGHVWWIATRIEEVSRAEIQQHHEARLKQQRA